MIVRKRPNGYGLEEYMRDKEQAGYRRATSILQQTSTPPERQSSYVRPSYTTPQPAGTLRRMEEAYRAKNPASAVPAPPPSGIEKRAAAAQKPGEEAEPPLTQQQLSAQLTTAFTSQMMNEALQSLVDFNNRRFKYNAKESPLYTILERQAAEEARLASGRAYARSAANTGGYGSSYATLSAEEASRQVMEGLDDQQLALYQAAKDEFEAERQSRVDWYNQAKQMHEDALTLEEYEKLKAEEEARAAGGVTETVQNAYNAVLQIWDGTNEEQVRSALKNQGLTDAEIESTVGMLKRDTGASFEDAIKQYELNPSVADALSIADMAKTAGMTDAYGQRISQALGDGLLNALSKPDEGFAILGIEQEQWANMSDGDKADALIGAAIDSVKSGALSGSDFERILEKDMTNGLNDAFASGKTNTTYSVKNAIDVISGIMSIKDAGYLTSEQYDRLLEKAAGYPSMNKVLSDYGAGSTINRFLSDGQEEVLKALIAATKRKPIAAGKEVARGKRAR